MFTTDVKSQKGRLVLGNAKRRGRHETMENAWTGQTSTTLIDNQVAVMPMPRIGWYVLGSVLVRYGAAMTSSDGLLFAAPTAAAQ